jgi:hypothetical protein
LRFEVQRRYPSKRRGIGGQPPAKLRGHGPEVTLREMGRSCRRWLAFHDGAWTKITPTTWERFVRNWSLQDGDTLRQLLRVWTTGWRNWSARLRKSAAQWRHYAVVLENRSSASHASPDCNQAPRITAPGTERT